MKYIPLTWTTINNLFGSHLNAEVLKEMMVILMLNYQADEFMEAVVGTYFEFELEPIKTIVHSFCTSSLEPEMNGRASGKRMRFDQTMAKAQKPGTEYTTVALNLESVRNTFRRFTKYVLKHAKVAASSFYDQNCLSRELETFLLAHITHIEDNFRLRRQESSMSPLRFLNPRSTYYDWVHATSADHTSCPYSSAFISCLMSVEASDCFNSSLSKYLAEDLCSHLAVMCRQYNDYGSIARDRNEQNLNSVNFPEFYAAQDGRFFQDQTTDADLKATLFDVAEFERECLMATMEKLLDKVPTRVAKMLRVFVGVTDLYGQIYMARDIGIASRSG